MGRWSLNLRGVVALGGNDQEVKTKGERFFQTPTTKLQMPYGLLVLPTNTGDFEHWAFDMMSECGVTVGFQVTDWLRATVGYELLYWMRPIRAGDQIDAINPTQIGDPLVGPARPAIPFKQDFFWAQGLTTGLELRW
jgi:hypothetical protein